jgi:MFS family permease
VPWLVDIAAMDEPLHEREADSPPVGAPWHAIEHAIVVAAIALMVELVATYARTVLPKREQAGALLDQFDVIVGSLPLLGSSLGAMLGPLIAVVALTMLAAGWRVSERALVLQTVTAVACAGTFALAVRSSLA